MNLLMREKVAVMSVAQRVKNTLAAYVGITSGLNTVVDEDDVLQVEGVRAPASGKPRPA